MFLDYNAEKSWPAQLMVKDSGSFSQRTSGDPRLGITALRIGVTVKSLSHPQQRDSRLALGVWESSGGTAVYGLSLSCPFKKTHATVLIVKRLHTSAKF